MSNSIFAASKRFVDYIDDDPAFPEEAVVYTPTIYGLVSDDYGEMEVFNFDRDDPLGNVKKAFEIMNEIVKKGYGTVRAWYEDNRDEDYYWMRED